MIPVVSAAEAGRMDERANTSVDTLMDRAGLAVALAAADCGAGYGTRVVVLCGPGNNGGDGYVAARYLNQRGALVRVEALTEPKTGVARRAAQAARRAGVTISDLGGPEGDDLVVDALFGGGFRHGLPDAVARWFSVDAPVVSVDVPSGLDPDTGEAPDGSFRADRTVTFGALKLGHLLGEGPGRCGEVSVADIGLGPATEPGLWLVENEDAPRPRRPLHAHKWSAGSVLIVGGSLGMVGAAVMAGRSALHFGAGSVGVLSSEQHTIAVQAPELLSYPPDRLEELLARFDVAVVGPGLGDQPQLLEQVLSGADRVVADADALMSLDVLARATGELIVTPHAGEFARLSDDQAGPDSARKLAEQIGGVVLLKGWPTYVTDGSVPWAVISGGPELATIGTGDVLSGMVAALWARGLEPVEAARSGAYWHGVAGGDLSRETVVTAERLSRHVGYFGAVSR
ncbi:MAG: NAD(P)H-hydrate dehydratase [Acidimicrobiia bacterium]